MKGCITQTKIDNYKVEVFAELEKKYGTENAIHIYEFISDDEIICAIKNQVVPIDFAWAITQ